MFRNGVREAVNLDLATDDVEHTTFADARRLTDEIQHHRYLNLLAHVDLKQIDMQKLTGHRVDLIVLDESAAAFESTPGEVEHLVATALSQEDALDHARIDIDAGMLASPVEHTRELTCPSRAPRGTFAHILPGFDRET